MTNMFVLIRKFDRIETPAVLMGYFDNAWKFNFPLAIDEGCTAVMIVPEHQTQEIKTRVENSNAYAYSETIGLGPIPDDVFIDKIIPLEQWLEIVNKYGKFPA